jgi:uncharacterized protein
MAQGPAHQFRGAPRRLATVAALAAIAVSSHAAAALLNDGAPADPGDFATAVQSLQALAAHGSAPAQLRLGMMYAAGQGVGRDDGQAAKWLAMAADQGQPGARISLIALCAGPRSAPLPQCLPLAASIKAAAVRGDPQAEIELGSFYLVGAAGLPKDPAAAVGWYRTAADQGYTRAEFQLGLVYATGLSGANADPGQAVSWFRKAADQGDITSMHTLAMAYQNGLYGVVRDPAQAMAWYLKAANAGDPSALSALASIYAGGEGVAEDPVQAVYWYRKAAEHGDPNAAANLASAYAAGKGTAQDDVQAYVWMDVAIAQTQDLPGGARGYWITARDLLEGRLTRSQLVDAKTQAAALEARLAAHD